MRRPRVPACGRASALAAAGWLVAWQLVSWAAAAPVVLPGPLEVAGALVVGLGDGAFWRAILWSAGRIMLGLGMSYLLAVPLAWASRRWDAVRAAARPPLRVMHAAPIACTAVLLLLWFGSAWVGCAAVVLVALPSLYFPLLAGLDAAPVQQREVFDAFDVHGLRRWLGSTWQQTVPALRAAGAGAVGMAWKAGVAAELIGISRGSVGEQVFQAKVLLETADVFAWAMVVVLLSTACERVLDAVLAQSASWALRIAMRIRRSSGEGTCCGAVCLRHARSAHDGCAPVSLTVAPGERVCLMAPSGAGKTSCLRMIAGLDEPAAGAVEVSGRIAMRFQEPRLIESATAVQNIALFANGALDSAEIAANLGALAPGLDACAPVSSLSGGQRGRVALLRALGAPADIVLLDEPFSGLDEAAHRATAAWVAEVAGKRALVVATHDPRDAELLGARVVVLDAPGGGADGSAPSCWE